MISLHRRRQAARMGAGKSMKRTSFAVTLLVLAAGLLADPLFCCALPAGDHVAIFSRPAMDCCAPGDTSGCAPKLEKAASLAPIPVATAPSVLTAPSALPVHLQVSSPGSMFFPPCPTAESPPRLHLLNSLFRI